MAIKAQRQEHSQAYVTGALHIGPPKRPTEMLQNFCPCTYQRSISMANRG